MPASILRLTLKNVKTEAQVRVINARLKKLPEILYTHIDLSNSELYIKHKKNSNLTTLIKNSLMKMGYQLKEKNKP